jgi:prolipoprotein diacylglyceryl transferase
MQLIISFIHWNLDSDIFKIPGTDWPVRWYGLMWAIGLIISQQVMYYIFKNEHRPAKDVDTLTLYIIIATLLGARLGHFLFYDPSVFITDPLEIILPPYSGLASHGAAAGILIGLYFFCRKMKYNYLWMVDRLVIVVCITGGFIRLGNLLNSEILGKPTNVPWAFVFGQVDNIPRHPAQLYEAVYCFLLFAILFYIWKSKRAEVGNGLIFGLFLIVLWTLRFIDEFFKEVQEPFEQNLPLNMGQILSIPLVIAGFVILIRSRRKPATPVTTVSSSNE